MPLRKRGLEPWQRTWRVAPANTRPAKVVPSPAPCGPTGSAGRAASLRKKCQWKWLTAAMVAGGFSSYRASAGPRAPTVVAPEGRPITLSNLIGEIRSLCLDSSHLPIYNTMDVRMIASRSRLTTHDRKSSCFHSLRHPLTAPISNRVPHAFFTPRKTHPQIR